jgi:hypothetical protein
VGGVSGFNLEVRSPFARNAAAVGCLLLVAWCAGSGAGVSGRRAALRVAEPRALAESSPHVLLPSPGGVYALIAEGGGAKVIRWDGRTVTESHLELSLGTRPVMAGPADLWGIAASAHGREYLHWDGRTASRVAAPALPADMERIPYGLSAVAADDIWSVGAYRGDREPGAGRGYVEHYDGNRWTRAPAPAAGYVLSAVVAVGHDDVWAYGWLPEGDAVMLHWDGKGWTGHPIRAPSRLDHGRFTFSAGGHDDVWARGTYDTNQPPRLLHWDGHRWQAVADPVRTPTHGEDQQLLADGSGGVWVSRPGHSRLDSTGVETTPPATLVHLDGAGRVVSTSGVPRAPAGRWSNAKPEIMARHVRADWVTCDLGEFAGTGGSPRIWLLETCRTYSDDKDMDTDDAAPGLSRLVVVLTPSW